MIFSWREIPAKVPAEPGVYAWYYAPEITEFDLNRIISEVDALKAAGEPIAALNAVREFLEANLFRYFREDPYEAVLRGPLKPRFDGFLEHRPTLSDSVVERVVEDPTRLRTIKRVLEASAPNFASPLYIGMSERLRSRLGRHKSLIERYAEAAEHAGTVGTGAETERRDHSFARQVSSRGMARNRLFVIVHAMPVVASEYVDVENILNRIHYPLLGRN